MIKYNTISVVGFHDHALPTLWHDSEPYVAMKNICEGIGLDWHGQRQRINRHPVLSEGAVMITSPSNGGLQQYLCIKLSLLNGWLFGVDVNRVKPEIRERLIRYQRECYQVLYEYWSSKRLNVTCPMQQSIKLPSFKPLLDYRSVHDNLLDLNKVLDEHSHYEAAEVCKRGAEMMFRMKMMIKGAMIEARTASNASGKTARILNESLLFID